MNFVPNKYDGISEEHFIHIFGGGTVSHVRAHLALTAPAYGETAKKLYAMTYNTIFSSVLWLTKMAAEDKKDKPETNEDIKQILDEVLSDSRTKIIFFNVAMVDFEGSIIKNHIATKRGKYEDRLKTSDGLQEMVLQPAPKLIRTIKERRPDVVLVGFKTTCGADFDEHHKAGMKLLKEAKCDVVLANDIKTRENMILLPGELWFQTTDRDEAIEELFAVALK